MAVQRKDLDFLNGRGVNLAVPIHKDRERNLVMLNWRPDRLTGRLRSRLGLGSTVASYSPNNIHSIHLHNGSVRYVGAGGALFRNTTSVLTGLDGNRLFLVSQRGFVWIMNRSEQKRDNGSVISDWGVTSPGTAPSVAVGAAGVLVGNIQYGVSFEDTAGFEGSAGPLSAAVTFASEQADLTSIPTGPAGTAARHIYRIGGGLDRALRIATIADNTTTTYTDNQTNEVAEILNIEVALDHDPPPAARGCCHYGGSLVAWSTAANPNRLFFSGVNGPWYFPASRYKDIGDSGENILCCQEVGGVLAIFKERSLWRFVGDFDDFSLEQVSGPEFGVLGDKAISIGKSRITYGGRKGIYDFAGDEPVKLSAALDPIFNGEPVITGVGAVLPPINLMELNEMVIEQSDTELYVSYPGNNDGSNGFTAILHRPSGEWVHDSRGFSAMHQEGSLGAFTVATGVQLWFMDNGQTDGTNPIHVSYQSVFHDFGYPDNDKQVFEIVVEHQLQSEVLNVKVLYDRDTATAATALGTITGSGTTRFPISADEGRMCHTISILIDGDVDAEVELTRVQATYLVHPRQTRQWVSAVVQNLQENVWECRAIQMEIDAPAANFNMRLGCDTTGSVDVVNQHTLAATVTGNPGRRVYPVTLPSSSFGRLWRMSADCASPMRVYRAMFEARRVPIYLNGTRSEFFEDQPISLGV
jgi:hypothetical protein